MAQTTEGLSFVAAEVGVSQDGITWLDLSGFATSIALSGGDRSSGEVNTYASEIPIVKAGKRVSTDVTVRYVYTEEAVDTGAFLTIREWFNEVGGEIFLRYWPKGEAYGNLIFTTGPAICLSFLEPQGEAADGAPVLGEFTVKCASLTASVSGGPS